MLVVPGRQRGHVQLIDLDSLGYYWSSATDNNSNNTHPHHQPHPPPTTANVSIIAAHSGKLSCVALNHDGTKCATSSDKGTLIRVFNTTTGTLLNELRRGMDRAEIFSIAFNQDSTRLCVSSDKGTIHIFNLDPSTMSEHKPRGPTYGQVVVYPTQSPSQYGLTQNGNRGSSLSFMKDLLPKYFSSEWSFAHAKIITESQCLVAFEQKNTILGKSRTPNGSLIHSSSLSLAICADGSCYKFYFDPKKGGECVRESFERFYKPDSL
jgi:WD40 repeat protein